MQNTVINEIIETTLHDDRTFEIRVHPFSCMQLGLYEEGMRLALKKSEESGAAVLRVDFSERRDLTGLDEKSMFDVLQFVSFNCLRRENAGVHWGDCILKYLMGYSLQNNVKWKMSSATIKKLLSADCGCLDR